MAAPKVTVIGSFLSPMSARCWSLCRIKGVAFEIDPIVPFHGDDRFSKLSPLRRIPVLIDDRVTLSDSTVICEYVEERRPPPALYPRDVADRARARWLEEFADTRMGEVFIWRLFNEVAINPFVWGKATDQAVVRKALDEEIPSILAYLEDQLPAEGFLFGEVSIADVAIAAFFRNAAFARFTVDSDAWPRTAAFVDGALALDAFQRLMPFEACSLRTPLAKHREALAALGATLTAETFGSPVARRGIMQI